MFGVVESAIRFKEVTITDEVEILREKISSLEREIKEWKRNNLKYGFYDDGKGIVLVLVITEGDVVIWSKHFRVTEVIPGIDVKNDFHDKRIEEWLKALSR